MKTAVASDEQPGSSLLFIVSKDGTVIEAKDCLIVATSTEGANTLVEEHSDDARYTVASSLLSAVPAEDAWWTFQANEG